MDQAEGGAEHEKMSNPLYRFSQFTVLAAFTLILIGSLVTTNGAGMAFADWPLSAGSLNPDGWWSHFFQRLEHGHRLFAELTGLLVGILCAWVWGNRWALPGAIAVSAGLSIAASSAPPRNHSLAVADNRPRRPALAFRVAPSSSACRRARAAGVLRSSERAAATSASISPGSASPATR